MSENDKRTYRRRLMITFEGEDVLVLDQKLKMVEDYAKKIETGN